MRCFGITNKRMLCRNVSKYPFCKQHRFQPVVLLFTLSSIIGLYAGLWQDFIKPFFLNISTVELNYSITPDESNYLPGLLVDEVVWEEDFRAYFFKVENLSSSTEIYDLRVDLVLPGAIVNYKVVNQQGCQDFTFSQDGATGGILSNTKVRATIDYYVNNLSINVVRFFPNAQFTVKAILKFMTIDEGDSGLFRLQYRFEHLDENVKTELIQHPIVISNKERRLFYIDKKNPPSNKVALQIIPKKSLAFRDDGSIAYGVQGQTDESIRQFELAIERNPESAPSYLNLGKIYAKRNRVDDAIAMYKLAIRYKPDYIEAYLELGYAYSQKGQDDEALSLFIQVLKYDSTNAIAYNYIGIMYLKKGKFNVAIENYQSAIRFEPGYPEAHYNLALAFLEKRLIDDAIVHLEAVRKYRPDVLDTYLRLALAYKQKKMKNQAVEILKIYLKQAANDKNQAKQIKEVERMLLEMAD